MFKQKASFALNISDHSLEILELREDRGSFVAASYGRALLESSIVEDGKVIAHDKLKLALKRLLQQAKPQPPSSREVIIAIPESKVFVTTVDLPRTISERNIPAALASRARELIPLDPAQTAADFLKSSATEESVRYVYAATYRDLIQEYQDIFQSVRIKVSLVSLESTALAHAVIDPSTEETVLLIDIGARTTIASIFAGGILQDSITVRIAGNNLTNALSEKLKISPVDAEQRKITLGLLSAGAGNGAEMLILQGQLQPLKDELVLFVKYYEEKGKAPIDRILLSGGSASLKGIAEYVESNIGLPTALAKPLPQFASVLQTASLPKFLVAVGLASIPFQKRPIINFLARSDKDWQPHERLKIARDLDADSAEGKRTPRVSHTMRQTLLLLGVLFLAAALFGGMWVWKNGLPFSIPIPAGIAPEAPPPAFGPAPRSRDLLGREKGLRPEREEERRQLNFVVQPLGGAGTQKQSLSFSFVVSLVEGRPPLGSVAGILEEQEVSESVVYDTATEEYVRKRLIADRGEEVASNPAEFTTALQQHLAHTLWESKVSELAASYTAQQKTIIPLYLSAAIQQSAEPTIIDESERTLLMTVRYRMLILEGTARLEALAKPYVDVFTLANPGYAPEQISYQFDERELPQRITVTALYSYVSVESAPADDISE